MKSETNHKRLSIIGNKLRVAGAGGGGGWVMDIRHVMDEHWVLYKMDESLTSTSN